MWAPCRLYPAGSSILPAPIIPCGWIRLVHGDMALHKRLGWVHLKRLHCIHVKLRVTRLVSGIDLRFIGTPAARQYEQHYQRVANNGYTFYDSHNLPLFICPQLILSMA